MAKIAFTKLGLTKNIEKKNIEWNNQQVEIIQYLPIEDKLNLIARIISFSEDEHVFYNPIKIKIFETIEIVLAYTNINLTEKQGEDTVKLYDLFTSSGFAKEVLKNVPEEEIQYVCDGVEKTIQSIYEYKNSLMGILQQVSQDYKNLNLDANKITEAIQNPEVYALIKQVIDKLG